MKKGCRKVNVFCPLLGDRERTGHNMRQPGYHMFECTIPLLRLGVQSAVFVLRGKVQIHVKIKIGRQPLQQIDYVTGATLLLLILGIHAWHTLESLDNRNYKLLVEQILQLVIEAHIRHVVKTVAKRDLVSVKL